MKRALLIMIVAILLAIPSNANRPDSLSCNYDHSFSLPQAIVPGSLLISGIVITSVPDLHQNIDYRLRDWVISDGHESWHGDNYMQYLPIATPFVLNLCGVKGSHNLRDLVCLSAGTYILGSILLNGTKYTTFVERPYSDSFNSFPSGHTFTAFAGAEILRREYGKDYPWIGVAGYAVATSVGLLRIYNNSHWMSDVMAGAGLGILSASITYWLAPYLRF